MTTPINDFLDKLQVQERERYVLLKTLEMWGEIESFGMDPDLIDRFGWSTKLVPTEEMNKARRDWIIDRYDRMPVWYGEWLQISGKPRWYNYVILNDGTQVTLPRPIMAPEYR